MFILNNTYKRLFNSIVHNLDGLISFSQTNKYIDMIPKIRSNYELNKVTYEKLLNDINFRIAEYIKSRVMREDSSEMDLLFKEQKDFCINSFDEINSIFNMNKTFNGEDYEALYNLFYGIKNSYDKLINNDMFKNVISDKEFLNLISLINSINKINSEIFNVAVISKGVEWNNTPIEGGLVSGSFNDSIDLLSSQNESIAELSNDDLLMDKIGDFLDRLSNASIYSVPKEIISFMFKKYIYGSNESELDILLGDINNFKTIFLGDVVSDEIISNFENSVGRFEDIFSYDLNNKIINLICIHYNADPRNIYSNKLISEDAIRTLYISQFNRRIKERLRNKTKIYASVIKLCNDNDSGMDIVNKDGAGIDKVFSILINEGLNGFTEDPSERVKEVIKNPSETDSYSAAKIFRESLDEEDYDVSEDSLLDRVYQRNSAIVQGKLNQYGLNISDNNKIINILNYEENNFYLVDNVGSELINLSGVLIGNGGNFTRMGLYNYYLRFDPSNGLMLAERQEDYAKQGLLDESNCFFESLQNITDISSEIRANKVSESLDSVEHSREFINSSIDNSIDLLGVKIGSDNNFEINIDESLFRIQIFDMLNRYIKKYFSDNFSKKFQQFNISQERPVSKDRTGKYYDENKKVKDIIIKKQRDNSGNTVSQSDVSDFDSFIKVLMNYDDSDFNQSIQGKAREDRLDSLTKYFYDNIKDGAYNFIIKFLESYFQKYNEVNFKEFYGVEKTKYLTDLFNEFNVALFLPTVFEIIKNNLRILLSSNVGNMNIIDDSGINIDKRFLLLTLHNLSQKKQNGQKLTEEELRDDMFSNISKIIEHDLQLKNIDRSKILDEPEFQRFKKDKDGENRVVENEESFLRSVYPAKVWVQSGLDSFSKKYSFDKLSRQSIISDDNKFKFDTKSDMLGIFRNEVLKSKKYLFDFFRGAYSPEAVKDESLTAKNSLLTHIKSLNTLQYINDKINSISDPLVSNFIRSIPDTNETFLNAVDTAIEKVYERIFIWFITFIKEENSKRIFNALNGQLEPLEKMVVIQLKKYKKINHDKFNIKFENGYAYLDFNSIFEKALNDSISIFIKIVSKYSKNKVNIDINEFSSDFISRYEQEVRNSSLERFEDSIKNYFDESVLYGQVGKLKPFEDNRNDNIVNNLLHNIFGGENVKYHVFDPVLSDVENNPNNGNRVYKLKSFEKHIGSYYDHIMGRWNNSPNYNDRKDIEILTIVNELMKMVEPIIINLTINKEVLSPFSFLTKWILNHNNYEILTDRIKSEIENIQNTDSIIPQELFSVGIDDFSRFSIFPEKIIDFILMEDQKFESTNTGSNKDEESKMNRKFFSSQKRDFYHLMKMKKNLMKSKDAMSKSLTFKAVNKLIDQGNVRKQDPQKLNGFVFDQRIQQFIFQNLIETIKFLLKTKGISGINDFIILLKKYNNGEQIQLKDDFFVNLNDFLNQVSSESRDSNFKVYLKQQLYILEQILEKIVNYYNANEDKMQVSVQNGEPLFLDFIRSQENKKDFAFSCLDDACFLSPSFNNSFRKLFFQHKPADSSYDRRDLLSDIRKNPSARFEDKNILEYANKIIDYYNRIDSNNPQKDIVKNYLVRIGSTISNAKSFDSCLKVVQLSKLISYGMNDLIISIIEQLRDNSYDVSDFIDMFNYVVSSVGIVNQNSLNIIKGLPQEEYVSMNSEMNQMRNNSLTELSLINSDLSKDRSVLKIKLKKYGPSQNSSTKNRKKTYSIYFVYGKPEKNKNYKQLKDVIIKEIPYLENDQYSREDKKSIRPKFENSNCYLYLTSFEINFNNGNNDVEIDNYTYSPNTLYHYLQNNNRVDSISANDVKVYNSDVAVDLASNDPMRLYYKDSFDFGTGAPRDSRNRELVENENINCNFIWNPNKVGNIGENESQAISNRDFIKSIIKNGSNVPDIKDKIKSHFMLEEEKKKYDKDIQFGPPTITVNDEGEVVYDKSEISF